MGKKEMNDHLVSASLNERNEGNDHLVSTSLNERKEGNDHLVSASLNERKEGNDHPLPPPKEGNELRERANEVFDRHTVDVLYATSDGMLFITKEEAEKQAWHLTCKKILTINKKETE